jgi:hypothetical protein
MQAGDLATWAGAAVAIIAAVVSQRGAASAKRSAHADEQMLYDQRKPDFDALVEDQNGDRASLGGTPLLSRRQIPMMGQIPSRFRRSTRSNWSFTPRGQGEVGCACERTG